MFLPYVRSWTRIAVGASLTAVVLATGARVGRVAATPAATASRFEIETVRLVNQERTARGLPALGTDRRLFEVTELHAEWMAASGTFSHRDADGGGPADRAVAAGYRYTALGEVLARGQRTPRRWSWVARATPTA
jgi:uncharacterized protein YkwD